MSSLQDKICNGLTLVGLLSVIGWGTASLVSGSEQDAEKEAETESVEETEQAVQDNTISLETVEEAPMVEDPHKADHEGETTAVADSSSFETESDLAVHDTLSSARKSAAAAVHKDSASVPHSHAPAKAKADKHKAEEVSHAKHSNDSIK